MNSCTTKKSGGRGEKEKQRAAFWLMDLIASNHDYRFSNSGSYICPSG